MLTFDSASHTYRHEGIVIPGVTSILGRAGMAVLPPMNDSRLIRKRMIGRAVHLACQYMDQGGVDWDSLEPDVAARARGYEAFLKYGFKPALIEHPFTAEIYGLRYAGTLDRTGTLFDRPFLLDIKTPEAAQPHWAIQTAGYDLGILPPIIRPFRWQRASLRLLPDGTFRLTMYDDPVDFDVFRAALEDPNHPAVSRWKSNNNIATEEED